MEKQAKAIMTLSDMRKVFLWASEQNRYSSVHIRDGAKVAELLMYHSDFYDHITIDCAYDEEICDFTFWVDFINYLKESVKNVRTMLLEHFDVINLPIEQKEQLYDLIFKMS